MAVGLLEEYIRVQEQRAKDKESKNKKLNPANEIDRVQIENNAAVANTSRRIIRELAQAVAKLKGAEYG